MKEVAVSMRLPLALKDIITLLAKEDSRSFNNWCVKALQEQVKATVGELAEDRETVK